MEPLGGTSSSGPSPTRSPPVQTSGLRRAQNIKCSRLPRKLFSSEILALISSSLHLMVSDDMRLFFWNVGPVMRVLTEIRFMPHSLTAEEQGTEPMKGIFPSAMRPLLFLFFCFLPGHSGAVWPTVPTRSCWSCQTDQFPQQLKNPQKIL